MIMQLAADSLAPKRYRRRPSLLLTGAFQWVSPFSPPNAGGDRGN